MVTCDWSSALVRLEEGDPRKDLTRVKPPMQRPDKCGQHTGRRAWSTVQGWRCAESCLTRSEEPGSCVAPVLDVEKALGGAPQLASFVFSR